MSQPSISIIIPVYNDPEGVRQTVDSLIAHTDSTAEIILVDNDSTDRTPETAAEYAEKHDHVLLVVEREIQSSYAARNTGIEHATSDLICFLDADQTVTDGWLETALETIDERDAHYLAPNVHLVEPDNPTLAGRYNTSTGFPIADFLERHHYAPTSCLFVTRELLEDVGTFDERLISGGDKEFGNRVHDTGYELHYAPEIVVHHPARNSLRALAKRSLRIGGGHCQLQQYYPDRYGRVGIPPRPSGIHGDQIRTPDTEQPNHESSRGFERILFTMLALGMTATRGIGYYKEYLRWIARRISGT
ncbi:glycosyltransferase [Halorubrum pallidum]|uniref:Glycosyltransferase n=1 Tax=Halorubrum pallidum TaxID=1526114 RepID=A0ABD5T509_9EURY